MALYFRFATTELEMAIKGREEAVKELLKEMLGNKFQQFLEECLSQKPTERKTSPPKKTAVEGRAAAEEGATNLVPAELKIQTPTLADMRSKANIANNKELVLLAIYYAHYCQKTPPNNSLIRRLLKEELKERDEVVNSVTTYLQRAKKQGWIEQEGKSWRITSTGLQKIRQILGPWAKEVTNPSE